MKDPVPSRTGRVCACTLRMQFHRPGLETVRGKDGNLFDIYLRITGDNAYTVPMRICPAPHYTMGGLWASYRLMSTIAGLFVAVEANFSEHVANRLGASALMQGLGDGCFIIPRTAEVKDRLDKVLAIQGKRSPDSFHRDRQDCLGGLWHGFPG